MNVFRTLSRISMSRSLSDLTLHYPSLNISIHTMASKPIAKMPRDPNTLSNYNNWATKHTTASFTLDFKASKLTGNVLLALESLTASESEEIVLDTSFLDIRSISVNDAVTKNWSLKERSEPYGSPLHIPVPGGKAKGEKVQVKIELETTDKCTALQWLTPAQTRGPDPYMFSQCQAIHARSLFPCK
jgi:leukotriene-A4 hydrolase